MSCSLRLAAALAVAAAAAPLAGGCSDDGGSDDPDAPINFDRRALLAHLADDFLLPTYEQFAGEAVALRTTVEAHCAALAGGGDGAATLTAAREAWATAMDTWELADAVLVGPAARDKLALRNRIYGWPLHAPCTVDQDVVVRWTTPAAYDIHERLDNARSLVAIEYLLHHADVVSSCPVTPAGWEALADDRDDARCALAATIAADVATHAEALADAWRTDGGDYRRQLVEAGTAGSSIPSEREAVNMVSDGLFYVDRMVKDMKLGEAAGIAMNACGTVEEPCLREVEHRYADRATPAIRANLRGLRIAFTGSGAPTGVDGPGFDDYLRAAGAATVADRMTASLDAAIAAADALPDAFIPALTGDRPKVVATHVAVKTFTDDLKTQFLTVLGLDIPDDVATDND